ncbi:hypothetical protein M0804_015230 [Polistes exclamans]|nr:hypothetical protein M0804_015230 [Polistes exclamans]
MATVTCSQTKLLNLQEIEQLIEELAKKQRSFNEKRKTLEAESKQLNEKLRQLTEKLEMLEKQNSQALKIKEERATLDRTTPPGFPNFH